MTHKTYSGGSRSDMENGEFEIQMRNGKYRRVKLEDGKRIPVSGGTWLYAALPLPAVIQAETQYYNFPLWVGKEWEGWRRLGRWRDSHATVTGIESVTTAAGTFEAYRIERAFVMFEGIYNYYDTYVYFYSPQTRSVVRYDYRREMKDLVGDVKYGLEETAAVELLSYKAEPESSDVRKAIGGDL